jgi:hypothetical protein
MSARNSLIATALIMVFAASCASRAKVAENPTLPDSAFYRWCDAFQREDFNALYGLLSTETKKALSEKKTDPINNAEDLKKFWGPDMPRLKQMLKDAKIQIEFKFEDYARGTTVWPDGTVQTIDFRRENGEWKIDLST